MFFAEMLISVSLVFVAAAGKSFGKQGMILTSGPAQFPFPSLYPFIDQPLIEGEQLVGMGIVCTNPDSNQGVTLKKKKKSFLIIFVLSSCSRASVTNLSKTSPRE